MQHLVRDMNADDWRIFQSYARRVRDINSSGLDGTHEIDIEIIRALCCPPTQGPLFPNLVSLTWEDRRNEAVPFLRYFLTPSLLHMIWNQHGGPEITRISLLPSIRSICPHMTEAILWSKDSSEQLAKATSDLICGWDLLESLMCGALSEEGWVHLASIPTLRVLKIGIGSLAFTPALLHSTAELRQAFSALEELFLYTGALDAHTSLITLMQHAPLKSIICSPSVPWTSKQLQTLVESLCNGVTGNTLQKFTLKRDNQLEESIHPGADHIAPIGAFRPLFRFCNLTNISVASLGGFIGKMRTSRRCPAISLSFNRWIWTPHMGAGPTPRLHSPVWCLFCEIAHIFVGWELLSMRLYYLQTRRSHEDMQEKWAYGIDTSSHWFWVIQR